MKANFVKCFDVVKMVTDEASKQFGSMWKANEERENALEKCCADIDSIAEEFNGISLEASVNDTTTDIKISLVCPEVLFESSLHRVYSLIPNAKSFGFSKVKNEDALQIDFVFPGIWDKMF